MSKGTKVPAGNRFWPVLLTLLVILAFCFRDSFQDSTALFSNDGPLGVNSSAANSLPETFKGAWHDLNWLGTYQGSALPSVTYGLFYLLGPVLYAKFYTPLSLLILGLAAWIFFRALKFPGAICFLGALAAALNTDYFSNACWGLGSKALSQAATFLALAAICSAGTRLWLRGLLSGLAIGVAVMEGFDVGAIFSLYLAAFTLFYFFVSSPTRKEAVTSSAVALFLIVAAAAFMSAHALSSLIGSQVEGITRLQKQQTPEEKWVWATQWSLPKTEILRVAIPGLYGYRMDSPNGGNYWGSVGADPNFEKSRQGSPRMSGSGEYAGILVVLIALWALVESFRKKNPVFTPLEKKIIWFWGVAVFISMILAFGRFAPFYQFVFALPYFSTIRNPIKFMHPFQMGMLILFGYGLWGLWKGYFKESAAAPLRSLGQQFSEWWRNPSPEETRWRRFGLALLGMSLFGWLLFAGSRSDLVKHLFQSGFPDDRLAGEIAGFAVREFGIFVLFLTASLLLLFLTLAGGFSGPRRRWGILCFSLLLILDLVRANQPWINTYNYRARYASNPVIEFLRQKPHEQRVAVLPLGIEQFRAFQQFYHVEWLQHHFQYYNIQSLDIIQMPRVSPEYAAFAGTFNSAALLSRKFELTSTRYLFSPAGQMVDMLNQQFDPGKNRYKSLFQFNIGQGTAPGTYIAETNNNGPFALVEFTGALPKAKLFTRWEVPAHEEAALERLKDPNFDPASIVLVAGTNLPAPPGAATTTNSGSVEYKSYAPKKLVLATKSDLPSVLLLNDKHDPLWKVWIDGKPDTVLRCNFLMRGVFLPAGNHTVEFRFDAPSRGLYISLAGWGLAALLVVLLLVLPKNGPQPLGNPDPVLSEPKPAPLPSKPNSSRPRK